MTYVNGYGGEILRIVQSMPDIADAQPNPGWGFLCVGCRHVWPVERRHTDNSPEFPCNARRFVKGSPVFDLVRYVDGTESCPRFEAEDNNFGKDDRMISDKEDHVRKMRLHTCPKCGEKTEYAEKLYAKDHGEKITINAIVARLAASDDKDKFRDTLDEVFFDGAWSGDASGGFVDEYFKRDVAGMLYTALHNRPAPSTSVLQPWVMRLPLREQGTLLTAIRGCDLTPKHPLDSVERRLVAAIRFAVMVPADPREVDSEPGCFMISSPPSLDEFKPSAIGHYPLHWVMHLMHAVEVLGYRHPDYCGRISWTDLYEKLCISLHVNAESKEVMIQRLGEDRIAKGEIVS